MPFIWPPHDSNLGALGSWVEGKYRLTPRIFVAARVDRLGFSTLTVSPGLALEWDAPVNRVEADAGYYVRRNLVLRFASQ